MAWIDVAADQARVQLSRREALGALRWRTPVTAPLRAILSMEPVDDAWEHLRGIRAPGTGFPGVIMLGTTRAHGEKDFCAVYGHTPGLVVSLDPAESEFARWVISGDPREAAPGLVGWPR